MERLPFRKTYEVVGYAFEADLHCLPCSLRRFGEAIADEPPPTDTEGNTVSPVFLEQATEDDKCGECQRRLSE